MQEDFGIEFFYDASEWAESYFEADGGDHYRSSGDVLNEFGFSGEEENVIVINDDIKNAKFFDTEEDAKRWMFEHFLEKFNAKEST